MDENQMTMLQMVSSTDTLSKVATMCSSSIEEAITKLILAKKMLVHFAKTNQVNIDLQSMNTVTDGIMKSITEENKIAVPEKRIVT